MGPGFSRPCNEEKDFKVCYGFNTEPVKRSRYGRHMLSLCCCVGTHCCTLDQQKKLLEEGENNVTVVQYRSKNKRVLQSHSETQCL